MDGRTNNQIPESPLTKQEELDGLLCKTVVSADVPFQFLDNDRDLFVLWEEKLVEAAVKGKKYP